MKYKLLKVVTLISIVLSGCRMLNEPKVPEPKFEVTKKQKVKALLKSIETGDTLSLSYINKNKYIQHNLYFPDGYATIAAFIKSAGPNSPKIKSIRLIQEGNLVFAHSTYNSVVAGFDIFRFENELIVEHWDNVQYSPNPNPSNRTMTDGDTVIKDHFLTELNKIVVKDFVNTIFVKGEMDKLQRYFK